MILISKRRNGFLHIDGDLSSPEGHNAALQAIIDYQRTAAPLVILKTEQDILPTLYYEPIDAEDRKRVEHLVNETYRAESRGCLRNGFPIAAPCVHDGFDKKHQRLVIRPRTDADALIIAAALAAKE